jgi:hypothetical protein
MTYVALTEDRQADQANDPTRRQASIELGD